MKALQELRIRPLVLLSDTDTAALPFVNLGHYVWVDFLLGFGAITGDSIDVTVECCTSNSTTGATLLAIPFKYKSNAGITADEPSALTTADSAGLGLDSDNGEKGFVIGFDRADITDGYNYVRVKITQQANTSVIVCGAR